MKTKIFRISCAILFVTITQVLSAQSNTNKPVVQTTEKTSIAVPDPTNGNGVQSPIPPPTEKIYSEAEIKAIREKKLQPDISTGVYKYEENKSVEVREAEKIETEKLIQPK